MKKTFLFLAVCALMSTAVAQNVTIKKGKATMSEAQYKELKAKADAYERMTAPMTSFNDSASYAIGRDIFNQWEAQQLGINGVMAGQAMIDAATGQSRLNDQQAIPLLQRFQREFERRQMELELQNNPVAKENVEKGEKFLREISNNKSVYTTKSGLKYRKIKEGNGKHPTATDQVKVHYTGTSTVANPSPSRSTPSSPAGPKVYSSWTRGRSTCFTSLTIWATAPATWATSPQAPLSSSKSNCWKLIRNNV